MKTRRNFKREDWCLLVHLICETLKFLWLSVFIATMVNYIANIASEKGYKPTYFYQLIHELSLKQDIPYILIGIASLLLLTGVAFFVRHHLTSGDLDKKREEHYRNIEVIFTNTSLQEAQASGLLLQEQQKLLQYEIAAFRQMAQEQQKISNFLAQIFQEQHKQSMHMDNMLTKQEVTLSHLTFFLQERSMRMDNLLAKQKTQILKQEKDQEDKKDEV